MYTSSDLKDKRVVKAGHAYVACVELARERYPGDDRRIDCGRHMTLRSAQVELETYPDDVFEGYDDPADTINRSRPDRHPKRFSPRPHKRVSYMSTRLYDRRIF